MESIHRKVLDCHLQHSGAHLQCCPRSPQIYESYPRQENGQAGRQVDRGYLQARPRHREFYPSGRYSSALGFGTLPLETHQLYYRREQPGAKLLDGFQLQTG